MASLKLNHIYKVYPNGAKAVNDFNIDIKDKEFIVFVGPSGCGKSTTLRMIAGLEEISAGELFIDDVLVNNVEPKNRDIAFVFQNYALYPHMTVYENMEFGLKCHKVAFKKLNENGNEVIEYRKLTKEEINKKILEAADILEITNYLDRKPKEMSGGQRQRVALGRALVRDPKVFLLDEPLSNLDAKLRTQMRTEITKLHKKIGTTFIYVTHDQTEAMTMGTRIVVMKDGFVQQIDTPLNLYNHPINKFVAGFIGTPQMNFYSAYLLLNGKNVEVKLNNNVSFSVPYEEIKKIDYSYLDGTKEVIIGCRPEHVKMGKGLKCVVNVVEKLGNETILYCSLENNEQIICKVANNLDINSDEEIKLSFPVNSLHFFDKETEINLIKDIPDNQKVDVEIKDNIMKIFNQKINLPEAITLEDGVYQVVIPNDGLVKGSSLTLPIKNKEEINNTIVSEYTLDNRSYFFKFDEDKFDLDFEKITVLKDGEVIVSPLQTTLELDGKILREKDKYYFSIEGYKVEADLTKVQKVALIDGTACHKKTYIFVFPISSASLTNEGLEVKDIKFIKYNKLYVEGVVNNKKVIIPVNDITNEKYLSLNLDEMKIYSNDILLA